jgi:hypothetical protein
LHLRDSTIYQNVGGIWNFGGSASISGSFITYNTRTGIFDATTMDISDSVISNNGLGSSSYGAAGIYHRSIHPMTVSGCTVADNGGPGILANGGLTVLASTVSGNNRGIPTFGDGNSSLGGIVCGGGTVLGSILVGNLGAGIVALDSTINGCTVSNSTGAGILMRGNTTVSGCVVTGNGANPDLSPLDGSGGIDNQGVGSVTGCTISGNSSAAASTPYYNILKPMGGGILNEGFNLTVSGCTISGNSADWSGGGIANFGSMDVEGCTVTGNTAGDPGGGLYNGGYGATLTIDVAPALGDRHSVFSGNTAPSGTNLQNDGTMTFNPTSTDAATVLTAAPDAGPADPGGVIYTVQMLAAQTGAPVRAQGTVTLYDGQNNVLRIATIDASATVNLYDSQNHPLGTTTLDANGRFSFPALPEIRAGVVAQPSLFAVYGGGGGYGSSTSAPFIQALNRLTVTFDAADSTTLQADADAVATMPAPVDDSGAPIPVAAVIRFTGTAPDLTLSTQDHVTLLVFAANGTTVVGNSPALHVTGGDVALVNVTLTTATDAPTVLVTGGRLTLRNDTIQESTGYNQAAVAVSGGGIADMGTAASPGGNTINVNGVGQALLSTGLSAITTAGSSFQVNGAPAFPVAAITLASSANPALPNQSVTFTATVSAPSSGLAAPAGTVTFVDTTTGTTLGVATLSAGTAQWTSASLPAGAQTVAAVFSGDGNYLSSAATLVQQVRYGFSGFQAPLNSNLVFGLNRTVPIKFQLTDSSGTSLSSLSAIVSLKVLSSRGTDVLGNGGGTALRYDPTAKQFIANWQTKGLSAGTYTVVLRLADGTTYQRTVQLAANGSGKLQADANGSTVATAGALLAGDVQLYVDNSNGELTADELARIDDAVAGVAALIAPYGVALTEVSDPTQASAILTMDTTSVLGGQADGVLGCTTDTGQITLVDGWDFYAASDTTQIGAAQYDFETVVTHELGHALGLGHSADATSVMYATLDPGAVKRALTTADLNVPDSDGADACGLHAAVPPSARLTSPFASLPFPKSAAGNGEAHRHGMVPARTVFRAVSLLDAVFTDLALLVDEDRSPLRQNSDTLLRVSSGSNLRTAASPLSSARALTPTSGEDTGASTVSRQRAAEGLWFALAVDRSKRSAANELFDASLSSGSR